jgi:putative thioredoxin
MSGRSGRPGISAGETVFSRMGKITVPTDKDMTTDSSDFSTDVLERSHTIPVLVDFWAEWCGPCKTLGPILERLAEKNKDRWILAKVNTDVYQEIAAQYGIRSIPCVKLFVDGKVQKEFTGALPERAVEQWLEKALPDRFAKELARAETLLAEDRTAEGRSVLESVLAQDAGNEHARVLLARSYVTSDRVRAAGLVEGIEEHSEHFPMADAIRTIAGLTQKGVRLGAATENPAELRYRSAIAALAESDFAAALDHFIEVIRMERSYDDDGARRAVIAIFRVLGDDHATTMKYRRAFSSALNA